MASDCLRAPRFVRLQQGLHSAHQIHRCTEAGLLRDGREHLRRSERALEALELRVLEEEQPQCAGNEGLVVVHA